VSEQERERRKTNGFNSEGSKDDRNSGGFYSPFLLVILFFPPSLLLSLTHSHILFSLLDDKFRVSRIK